MFINIKINFKIILLIISIIFVIIFAFNFYKIFNSPSNNNETINMDTSNYTNILKEIHSNLDLYIGQSIICDGYIYVPENLQENQFVLARNMMICCPSDTVVVGFLCTYSDINQFSPNTWIKIEGVINKYNYEETTIPIIEIQKIRKTLTPSSITVLPPTI